MTNMSGNPEIQRFYDRLFRQNERVMKFGLEAISKAIMPQDYHYPHILIGGTNGKGHVSALIANAAYLSGYRTGLFTSPHLVDFCERIRVDGLILPKDLVASCGWQVLREFGGDADPEFTGTTLTYFECCLVMALRLFKQENVNFGVFEVGLGGRLDATNALNPAISVITSIGLDHQNYLGDTPEQIAHEKAGIMRAGCPVICGRTQRDTLRKEAEIHQCSSFDALGESFDWRARGSQIELITGDGEILMQGAQALAPFQRDNAAVAFFTLLKAHKLGLIKGDIHRVFADLIARTKWVGRMYRCSSKSAQTLNVRQVILDGGHNIDGVRAFVRAVRESDDHGPHALILNSCRDKSIEQMFPLYFDAFAPEQIFVVKCTKTPRMCDPLEYCQRAGLNASQSCDSFDEALEKASKIATSQGTVYISGSLYLIGEAIELLDETEAMSSILI